MASGSQRGLSSYLLRAAGRPAALRIGAGEHILRVCQFQPRHLEAVSTGVVNDDHRLPLTRAVGASMLSSSDTQRFPTPQEVMHLLARSDIVAAGQLVDLCTGEGPHLGLLAPGRPLDFTVRCAVWAVG